MGIFDGYFGQVEKLLTLVGDFCTAHPRSKLPAACETAMEFAKSLCEKPDTRMLRDYGRQVVSVVDALCAMFCQVRILDYPSNMPKM